MGSTGEEEARASGELTSRCAFCRRSFDAIEDRLLVMRDGVVVAAYHEECRPDRRRKGCAGC